MRNQCTLFAYDQVPLVTFLLLCYSYIVANFSLPAKKATLQGYRNLKSEICSISLIVTVWIISFKENGAIHVQYPLPGLYECFESEELIKSFHCSLHIIYTVACGRYLFT